ncbi:MAG: D-2-hydroxyacid dehydrogenase [Chloroflexota bacterium]
MHKLLIFSSDGPEYARVFAERAPDLSVHVYKRDDPASDAFAREMDIMFAWYFPPALIQGAANLKWIQSTGAGADNIMAARPLPPGVVASRMTDIFGPAMAEYALGYMLATSLDVPRILAQQRERRWEQFSAPRVRGKTAVVVGMGSIGAEVCRTLKAAGLHVVGISRSGQQSEYVHEAAAVSSLDEVLPRADYLVLVIPLTDQSRGLIDGRRLRLLPASAWLINMCRGAVIVEEDLIVALQDGIVAGAVLDVFQKEPLPADNPLWGLPNVIVTPHISGPDDVPLNAQRFLENFARFKRGERLAGQVDWTRGY